MSDPDGAPLLPALDRRLAAAAALGAPLLFLALLGLSALVPPVAAGFLGLLLYWAGLGAALLRWGDGHAVLDLIEARSPGWAVMAAMTLPVVVVGAAALRRLGADPLAPHLLIAAGAAALTHAMLEELFWRGALIPAPTPRSAAVALGLFGGFHLAWLGARGVELGSGPLGLVAGALALGGAWTASRLLTGTLGAGLLAHAGFSLFAFAWVLAANR